MPIVPHLKLQTTLLHLTPFAPSIVPRPPFRLLRIHRTMSSKPSLQAAEDFLSFVNASPTRMMDAMT